MIDPVSIAVISTAVASLEGGANIVQIRHAKKMAKEIKRQRIELGIFQAGLIAAIVASAIDSKLQKSRYEELKNNAEYRIADLHARLDAVEAKFEARLNSINLSALDAKLDMVVAATATPKIIPKREDIIKEDKEGD